MNSNDSEFEMQSNKKTSARGRGRGRGRPPGRPSKRGKKKVIPLHDTKEDIDNNDNDIENDIKINTSTDISDKCIII
jgi:hypothetical protein